MEPDRTGLKPSLLRNFVSMAGVGVMAVSTAIGLPMMLIDLFAREINPYAGIFTYMILPAAAAAGLALTLAGVLWERRRRRLGAPVLSLPSVDLSDPRHRAAAAGALLGLLFLLSLLAVTGYRAYDFSDSVRFCGLVCHFVMKPEYTAYQHSSHARVPCVSCHIGPGVNWFVRSKITGAYQVYATAFNKYPRPIETPVKSLRPAQETCEQCHWPAKFYGAQQKVFAHTLADEKNSPWRVEMLLKVGGGEPTAGRAAGIHWHMNIKNKIFYIDSDGRREVIPWVRSVDPEGRATVYEASDSKLSPADIEKVHVRRMDCVDCHNRPSHIFAPPTASLDDAFDAGRLDPSLPYLKREGMRLLTGSYATLEEAQRKIAQGLPDFYRTAYPEIFKKKRTAVEKAVETLQSLYAVTIFPEMKADWQAHPNHIGHLNSDGCFRCHDGLHKSADGRTISNDCGACHGITAQGAPGRAGKARPQPAFKHPVDVGGSEAAMKCSLCHTGATGS